MIRPLSLSLTALSLFTFLSYAARAQELVPIIQLSPEETEKATHLSQDLKNARERDFKAKKAWEAFHYSYQSAHPDLLNVRFAADFRFAVASADSALQTQQVKAVELTSDEQRQLKALYKEMMEGQRSRRQSEDDWRDYQYQIAATHVPTTGSGAIVTLLDGKSVTIPSPWSNGLAFTPDFKFALPRTL